MKRTKTLSNDDIKTLETAELAATAGGGANGIVIGSRFGAGGFPHGILVNPELGPIVRPDLGPSPFPHGIPAIDVRIGR